MQPRFDFRPQARCFIGYLAGMLGAAPRDPITEREADDAKYRKKGDVRQFRFSSFVDRTFARSGHVTRQATDERSECSEN